MVSSIPQLEDELRQIQALAARVSLELRQAAEDLAIDESLPSLQLIDELRQLRSRVATLRKRISPTESTPTEDELDATTLAQVSEDIAACAIRETAHEILESVLALEHQERESFAPLETVRADADRLLSQWGEGVSNESTQQLVDGSHPIAALAGLVSPSDELSDSEWLDRLNKVSSAYGEELAAAAARGRLVGRDKSYAIWN
ncbi:hypothetical protein [Thalassoroseus pseudoceratinae]|uniref:hypothetical protein n=1 Tax=Thalassoroseus pseudoceratinae TaxID=2713176 RepID=UPI0014209577|nr:hypothetical protein [Thalassoroseus pseudoceratinae]